MAENFFENFPLINYNGQKMRNIILKSRIIRDIINNVEVYHPLVILDGERPDTIAYDYYGDSALYWLVLMSNDIVDPYYDWPLTYAEFNLYIVKKYGSIQAAQGTLLYWSNENYDYYMTPETKSLLSADDTVGWINPVYAYDYEYEKNENKRNIRLIDKSYSQQIVTEIGKIYG